MRKTMLAASAALTVLLLAANLALAGGGCGFESVTAGAPGPSTVADGTTVAPTPSSGG